MFLVFKFKGKYLMNILDIIIIIIFIVCLKNGYYKGFFREVFDIIRFILGIVIFKFLYPIINSCLLKSTFLTKVTDWVICNLKAENTKELTQQGIGSIIDSANIPEIFKKILLEKTLVVTIF